MSRRRKSKIAINFRKKAKYRLGRALLSVLIVLCFLLFYAGGLRTLGAALMSIST